MSIHEKQCSVHLFLRFLHKNPDAEKLLRSRVAKDGPPLVIKGSTVPRDVLREALEVYRKQTLEPKARSNGKRLRREESVQSKGKRWKMGDENCPNTRASPSNKTTPPMSVHHAEEDAQSPSSQATHRACSSTCTAGSSPDSDAPPRISAQATHSSDGIPSSYAQELPSPDGPSRANRAQATHSDKPTQELPPSPDAPNAILKAYFTALQVEYKHRAFERQDLLDLLANVNLTLARPLAELRVDAKMPNGTAVECLRQLLNPKLASPQRSAQETKTSTLTEAARISRIHETSYMWYASVLHLKENTRDEIQRQFRFYIKLFHPDKYRMNGHTEPPQSILEACEKVKKAKQVAEDALRRNLAAPGCVRKLTSQLICPVHGQRKMRLTWQPPQQRGNGDEVSKYTIQVLDPSYGQFLNICVLEPDYDEEKQKFVSIDQLNEFIIDETKLEKMSHLFNLTGVDFQVAAHNSVGKCGPYAKVRVNLSVRIATPATPPVRQPLRTKASSRPVPNTSNIYRKDTSVDMSKLMATYILNGEAKAREVVSRWKVSAQKTFLTAMTGCVAKGHSDDVITRIMQWLQHQVK